MIELEILTGNYCIYKLKPGEMKLPEIDSPEFLSVTRTCDEISIVADEKCIINDVEIEPGWKCLKVKGILDFSLIGILHSILNPLKDTGISVFVVSTFNTDYILIKKSLLKKLF